MKKHLKIFIPALLILFIAGNISAQKTPEETAKNFYAWYMKNLNGGIPVDNKTEMKKYISRRLANWVYSKSYQEYGADYFIDGQDYEEKWQPTLVSKAVIKGSSATLKVTLDVPKGVKTEWKKHVLPLKLVKENGVWKIDEINNRELVK